MGKHVPFVPHGTLHAIDAKNGAKLWAFGDEADKYEPLHTVSPDAAIVFVATCHKLHAIYATTGSKLSAVDVASNATGLMILPDGATIFVTTGNGHPGCG